MKSRILLVSPRYPPQGGGSAIFYSNLVNSLSSENTFYVITSYTGDDFVMEENGNTIYRFLPSSERIPAIIRSPIESIILLITSVVLILTKNIDFAHVHASAFSAIGISLATILSGIPIIYDCRDHSIHPVVIKRGNTPFWFSCAPTIDDLLKEYGISETDIVRAPVAQPEYVTNYRKPPGATSEPAEDIVFVGVLRRKKGIYELIDAVDLLDERDVQVTLTIVGDGPEYQQLMKYIQVRELGDYVKLVGEVEHEEALKEISQADVLIHPSKEDALPRTIIEAMVIGTPIIATRVGSTSDILSHAESGLLISPNSDEIANSIEELIEKPELRRTLVREAQKESEKWTWKHAEQQISTAYSSIPN